MFENILRDFDNVETRSSGSARIIMGTSLSHAELNKLTQVSERAFRSLM